MVKRFVTEWLSPFGQPRFRKPDQWAERLRPSADGEAYTPLPEALREGVAKAQEALLAKQNGRQGYWCAELGADTTLESDAIMLWNFLGRGDGGARVCPRQ